ncbi:MAG: hypothetical protein IJ111_07675 [Eggerthellaceae bacterium]|nr:hypothetical protein [Eggerthellaceae bacterium]
MEDYFKEHPEYYECMVAAYVIGFSITQDLLDETYAPASENLGSRMFNEETGEYEIVDIGADAQVNLNRGVVVTSADAEPISMAEAFGPQCFHNGDYTFFFENIKDNVAKRVAAYKGL